MMELLEAKAATLIVARHFAMCVQIILKVEKSLFLRSTENFNLLKCGAGFLVSAVVLPATLQAG